MSINVAKVPFLGIMIAATSREEAERLYAETAFGHSALAYSDKGKTMQFVTHAECSDLLNPHTGQADLEEQKELVNQLEFMSQSSDVNVHYTVCKDGCGAHLISESSEAMKNCITCGTVVTDLSEQEISALPTDQTDLDIDVSGIVATAHSLKSAIRKYVQLAAGKKQGHFLKDQEGNVFQSTSTAHKYNTFTGNEDITVVDAPADFKALSSTGDNIQAYYYVCANQQDCGLHVVSTSQDAVICPSCSSGLVESEEYEDEELDVEAELEDDMSEDDSDDMEDSDDSEDLDESDSGTKCSKSSDDSDEDSEDEESDDTEEEMDSDDEESEDEEEMEESEEDEEDSSLDISESVTIPVAALSMASVSAKDLHLCSTTINQVPTWLAISQDMIIAKANPVTAVKHKDLFGSKVFGEAVLAAAKEHGVEQALSDMGFEPVVHELDVPKLVQEQVEQQVSEQVASVSADAQTKIDQLAERYSAALATAFAGINKGLFKGLNNPMQTSLINALSSAGIKNSDTLVNTAFEASSSAYIQTVMKKAQEIMEFTAQAQNEVARMVSESTFQPASARTIADRLSSMATSVEVEPIESVSKAVPKSSKEDFAARASQVLKFGR